MKEIPKKDQAEVAGGGYAEGTCIPPATPPFGPDVTLTPDESSTASSQT